MAGRLAAGAGPPREPPLAGARAGRLSATLRFARYVAIGDSSTEGLVDPDGRGGYRGWSQRLAERIGAAQGTLLYANLAVRGRTTREIRAQQLERALALSPDLATVFSGTNDVLRPRFDVAAFADDVRAMHNALRADGATVLTFTLPDLTPLLPLARLIAPRIRAMNEVLRAVCAETGTLLVDFAAHPVTTDARLWNDDRIHANAQGHARIADALADALQLSGSDDAWREPLPLAPRASLAARVTRESRWVARYLLPWCWQGVFARTSSKWSPGKRPELTPVRGGFTGSTED